MTCEGNGSGPNGLRYYDGYGKQRELYLRILKDVCDQYRLAQNMPCYFDFEIMEDSKPYDASYIGCLTIGPFEREWLHIFSIPILLFSIPYRK